MSHTKSTIEFMEKRRVIFLTTQKPLPQIKNVENTKALQDIEKK